MIDATIIGAGPAGGIAAALLARAGVNVLLIDANAQAGGQIWRAGPALQTASGDALRAGLAGVTHARAAEVVDIEPRRVAWLDADGAMQETETRTILVAAGALEQFLPVPGWTRPGVFGLGGLQLLLKAGGVVPAGPVLLAGAGPLLYLVAYQLLRHGVRPSAVVDHAGMPPIRDLLALPDQLARGIGFELALRRAGVPILRRRHVVEIADDTALTNDGQRFPAATVGLGFGVRPNIELLQLLGCALEHDPAVGGWHPRRSAILETSVPGVFAAGDCAGIGGVEMALAEAPLAAAAIIERLGRTPTFDIAAPARRRRRVDRFRRAVAAWSALPAAMACDDATLLCRCEHVTVGAVRRAVGEGLDQPGPVKMATRAGMGLCQGRVCHTALALTIAERTAMPLGQVALPTVRPPLRPVPIGAYAKG